MNYTKVIRKLYDLWKMYKKEYEKVGCLAWPDIPIYKNLSGL